MRWKSVNRFVVLAAALIAAQAGAASRPCTPAPEISARLAELARQWQPRLQQEAGYAPVGPVTVCLISHGRPFADKVLQRVYVRPLTSLDAQITLAHEYLHLAFAHHPHGDDEVWVESLARQLVEQP
ncbi:DUF2300 domain-containing protein [Andreprevotia chitinilytica]|uniref:DUF2300 domain-containing protein n=1 Tax=Andreprevotia chitinilytica TaxID=396808 RepID=UPI00054DCB95|nr:DUF2300 domain-containing protein [Andreprevotia chitinilytica]